jgi:hypothetical protein
MLPLTAAAAAEDAAVCSEEGVFPYVLNHIAAIKLQLQHLATV